MYLRFKKIRYIVLLMIAGLLLSSGVWARETAVEQQPPPQKKIIRHVLIVTLDGVTEKGLKKSYTPNLNGLASGGIYAPGMDILPPDTAYHLAALLSGSDSENNGLASSVRRLKTDILPDVFIKYGRDAFYIVAENSAAKNFFSTARESLQVRGANGGDRDVVSTALAEFEKSRPYFMGLVLSGAKNSAGTGAGYYKAIGGTDEQLGRLLLKLKNMGVYDESLIIVTGSSNEKQIGQQNDINYQQLLVPVMIKGPGLKGGAKLPPVRIIDVAPTVAMLTGVNLSENSNGMVIWNGLQEGAGFVEEQLLQKRVKELSQEFMKSTGTVYQLEAEKRLVHSEKERIRKEKQEIQNIINRKNEKIEGLTNKIRIMQWAGLFLLLLCGVGYVLEYKFLRKKFLMF